MIYLSGEDILVIHSEIIDATGGLHGIRDIHLFSSIIDKPKATFGGKELYGDLFHKAASYFESLAKYHVFIDGNKRTSIGATARFLYINGYDLKTTNKGLENFTLKIVTDKLDLQIIASWLKKHAKKTLIK